MKTYNVIIGGKNIEVLQNEDGTFTKPQILEELNKFGTALKPAFEPICMARKPLGCWETKNTLTTKEKDEFQDLWDKMEAGMPYDEKRYEELWAKKEVKVFKSLSVAENVLKYGTGGINIDESRVETEEQLGRQQYSKTSALKCSNYEDKFFEGNVNGRFPANLIHDNSEEVRECFPETGKGNGKGAYNYAGREYNNKDTSMFNGDKPQAPSNFNDSGNASRFFKSIIYQAKSPKSERLICGFDCVKLEEWTQQKKTKQEKENTVAEVSLVKAILGLVAPSLSIGGYGNKQTEAYPTDFISTIRTAISKITELKTWNLLIQQPTNDSILAVIKEVMAGINYAEFAVSEKELIKRIGIFQKKITHSTEDVKNATYQSLLKISKPDAWQDAYSHHPTHKPVALMEYLIKMITPKGGIVLEPFAGSGSTLVAAKENGFGFIGIELTEDYIPIIEARTGVKAEKIQPIENVIQKTQTEPTSVIKEKPINTQKPKNDIDTCECGGRIVKTASGRCCEQCLTDY